jgi:hypothetical protein
MVGSTALVLMEGTAGSTSAVELRIRTGLQFNTNQHTLPVSTRPSFQTSTQALNALVKSNFQGSNKKGGTPQHQTIIQYNSLSKVKSQSQSGSWQYGNAHDSTREQHRDLLHEQYRDHLRADYHGLPFAVDKTVSVHAVQGLRHREKAQLATALAPTVMKAKLISLKDVKINDAPFNI